MLFAVDTFPIVSTQDKWLTIATPIAIIISHILQKLDVIRVKKALEIQHSLTKENQVKRDDKLNIIHSLVNGTMSEQKRITMMLAKRIAEMTKNEGDIAIAKQSEQAFIEHQKQLQNPSYQNIICIKEECKNREDLK
jgi:hypothetical protein